MTIQETTIAFNTSITHHSNRQNNFADEGEMALY